jgi:hypothetical protein
VKLFKRVRKLTPLDRRLHDFSLGSDDAGIPRFSATASNADGAFRSLAGYVQAKSIRRVPINGLGCSQLWITPDYFTGSL